MAGAPRWGYSGRRFAAPARCPRNRQPGPGVADPPPNVPEADRRAAARIHADGAIPRRVSPDSAGSIRTRRLFSVDRARAGPPSWGYRRTQSADGVPARAALRTGRVTRNGPGAGLHAG